MNDRSGAELVAGTAAVAAVLKTGMAARARCHMPQGAVPAVISLPN